jgi:hypothetical protein
MDDLLDLVLDAHGGSGRWSDVSTLTAKVAAGGPFWKLRGLPDLFPDETVIVDARREQVFFICWIGFGRSLTFDTEPERVTLLDARGRVMRSLVNPRPTYACHDESAPWDVLQAGYFLGYAMWNYLNTPFLLTYSGVHVREISPHQEDGQAWRRLLATFPAHMATHSSEQIFYFGGDGLLRRVDYAVDINAGARFADYAGDYQSFAGLAFPTRRRVYARHPDGAVDRTSAEITLDIHDITIA